MADEEIFTSYESMPPRSEDAAVVVPPAPKGFVPKPPAEKRSTHVTIRVTPTFKKALADAAERRGMGITQFVETLVGLALEADRKAGLIQ